MLAVSVNLQHMCKASLMGNPEAGHDCASLTKVLRQGNKLNIGFHSKVGDDRFGLFIAAVVDNDGWQSVARQTIERANKSLAVVVNGNNDAGVHITTRIVVCPASARLRLMRTKNAACPSPPLARSLMSNECGVR